jgi:hypothetical protein
VLRISHLKCVLNKVILTFFFLNSAKYHNISYEDKFIKEVIDAAVAGQSILFKTPIHRVIVDEIKNSFIYKEESIASNSELKGEKFFLVADFIVDASSEKFFNVGDEFLNSLYLY